MSDIVIILGAGASKDCGGPLMDTFLDEARRIHSLTSDDDVNTHFGRVFKAIGALQNVHSKSDLDIKNIEAIFTAFEMAKIIDKFPNRESKDIDALLYSLKELIVRTLEATIRFRRSGGGIRAPETYERFVAIIKHITEDARPKQTVCVITFNYDIALDVAIHQANLTIDYGFHDRPILNQKSLPLLKLHGSLNWAVEEPSGNVAPVDFRKYFNMQNINYANYSKDGYCGLNIGSKLKTYFARDNIDVRAQPFIVPPSWNKADYHSQLSPVWKAAARHLGEAKHIFILGYSMPETDQFFRLLYALGTVGDDPLTRIAVYNPDTSQRLVARFESMLGPGARARFELHNEPFSTAIHEIRKLFPDTST